MQIDKTDPIKAYPCSVWQRIVAFGLIILLLTMGWLPCTSMTKPIAQHHTTQMTVHSAHTLPQCHQKSISSSKDLSATVLSVTHHVTFNPECATSCGILAINIHLASPNTAPIILENTNTTFPAYINKAIPDVISSIKKPPKPILIV